MGHGDKPKSTSLPDLIDKKTNGSNLVYSLEKGSFSASIHVFILGIGVDTNLLNYPLLRSLNEGKDET